MADIRVVQRYTAWHATFHLWIYYTCRAHYFVLYIRKLGQHLQLGHCTNVTINETFTCVCQKEQVQLMALIHRVTQLFIC